MSKIASADLRPHARYTVSVKFLGQLQKFLNLRKFPFLDRFQKKFCLNKIEKNTFSHFSSDLRDGGGSDATIESCTVPPWWSDVLTARRSTWKRIVWRIWNSTTEVLSTWKGRIFMKLNLPCLSSTPHSGRFEFYLISRDFRFLSFFDAFFSCFLLIHGLLHILVDFFVNDFGDFDVFSS